MAIRIEFLRLNFVVSFEGMGIQSVLGIAPPPFLSLPVFRLIADENGNIIGEAKQE